MSKKIVVITESPGKNRNSLAMTGAFIRVEKKAILAKIKAVIDKLFSLVIGDKNIAGKDCVGGKNLNWFHQRRIARDLLIKFTKD